MKQLLATTLLASTLASAQNPPINYSINADKRGITNTVCAQQYTSQNIRPCVRVRGENGLVDTALTLQARPYGFNVTSTLRESDDSILGQHVLSRTTPIGLFRTRFVNKGEKISLQNSELEHTINNWRINAQLLYQDNEPKGSRVTLRRDDLGMTFFDTPQAHAAQINYRLNKNTWSMNLRAQARKGPITNDQLDYSVHAVFDIRLH